MSRLPKLSYRPEQKVITIPRPNVDHLRGKEWNEILIGSIKRKHKKYPNEKFGDYKWNNLDETTLCKTRGNKWFTEQKSNSTLKSNQFARRCQTNSTK